MNRARGLGAGRRLGGGGCLLIVVLVASCRGGTSPADRPGNIASPAAEEPVLRNEVDGAHGVPEGPASLVEALSVPAEPDPLIGTIRRGPWSEARGIEAQWWGWTARGLDSEAQALYVRPAAGSADPNWNPPTVLHHSGHWGGGVQSAELLPGATLLARLGIPSILLPLVGDERSVEPGTAWRTLHQDRGAWPGLQLRLRFGSALAWDVRAARSLLSELPPDVGQAGHTVFVGFSGGAERALALAALLPSQGLAIGAHEYAFGTDGGQSFCDCGALAHAWDEVRPGVRRVADWLPALPPRPTLLFHNPAQDPVDGQWTGPAVERIAHVGHGLSIDEHVAIAQWLRRLAGKPPFPEQVIDGARPVDEVEAGWVPGRDAYLPAPGGPPSPPWRPAATATSAGVPPSPALTGADSAGPWTPDGLRAIVVASARNKAPSDGTPASERHGPGEGAPFLLCVAAEPAGPWPPHGKPLPYAAPRVAGSAAEGFWSSIGPVVVVRPPFGGGHGSDLIASRWAVERGVPLWAQLTSILLEERARWPAIAGWVGLGACGPSVMAAAALSGDRVPTSLIGAPADLRPALGPIDPHAPAVQRWPTWTLAGSTTWPDIAALSRLVPGPLYWVEPLDELGRPWSGPIGTGATTVGGGAAGIPGPQGLLAGRTLTAPELRAVVANPAPSAPP